MLKKLFAHSERGQAIILVAFAIIGLVAVVGMAVDGGMLFIEYARLKRGIDGAAVAAALQFKQGATGETQAQFEARLATSAEEMLGLNQSDVFDVDIDICARNPDGTPVNAASDPALCTTVPRKMTRVTASRVVHFGFMPVVGIPETTIRATSIGEAASVDLVLVMDTSGSMSYETSGNPGGVDPGDDPSVCNLDNSCEPMAQVKDVAADFVENLYFPYDRVAIVASTSQVPDGSRDPVVVQELESDETIVLSALGGLKVFEPRECDGSGQPGACRDYADGTYGPNCELCVATEDWISYPSSNYGGALILAGNRFRFDNDPDMIDMVREDSLWLVIMLAGGPANATNPQTDLPFGYCPPPTNRSDDPNIPFCRDNDSAADTRHSLPNPAYDADDYAYDMADWLAGASTDTNPSDVDGQEAVIFTIGLGNFVQNYYAGDPMDGEELLRYMAEDAGDSISPGVILNHGFYSYSPDTAGLAAIFQRIADNIATRISE
jgi:Flp pilus assembly protein TadG